MNEFERKAWDSRNGADKHPPKRALEAILDDIEKGGIPDLKHAIIVLVREEGEYELISVVQAGTLSQLAVEGALNRAINLSKSQ